MSDTEYLDRPPTGDWFVLDIMPKDQRSRDWVALMIDVDPDVVKHSPVQVRSLWVRVPGKHRNHAALMRQRRRAGTARPAALTCAKLRLLCTN